MEESIDASLILRFFQSSLLRWLVLMVVSASGVWYVMDRRRDDSFLTNTMPAQTPSPPLAFQLDPEILESLKEISKDVDPRLRWAALEMIYRVNDPATASILSERFAEEVDPAVKEKIFKMLGDAKDRTAQPLFSLGLKDYDKQVRMAALVAIGSLGDPDVVAMLTPALNDMDTDIKLEALKTLQRLHHVAEEKQKKEQQDLLRNISKGIGVKL
ncbi:MAG: HEAT repeat domain-containing protein [Elusimicrobia bacterium]|nr:HEAT repeat domain-containing protein [Elusimicrobiota bacterium]